MTQPRTVNPSLAQVRPFGVSVSQAIPNLRPDGDNRGQANGGSGGAPTSPGTSGGASQSSWYPTGYPENNAVPSGYSPTPANTYQPPSGTGGGGGASSGGGHRPPSNGGGSGGQVPPGGGGGGGGSDNTGTLSGGNTNAAYMVQNVLNDSSGPPGVAMTSTFTHTYCLVPPGTPINTSQLQGCSNARLPPSGVFYCAVGEVGYDVRGSTRNDYYSLLCQSTPIVWED